MTTALRARGHLRLLLLHPKGRQPGCRGSARGGHDACCGPSGRTTRSRLRNTAACLRSHATQPWLRPAHQGRAMAFPERLDATAWRVGKMGRTGSWSTCWPASSGGSRRRRARTPPTRPSGPGWSLERRACCGGPLTGPSGRRLPIVGAPHGRPDGDLVLTGCCACSACRPTRRARWRTRRCRTRSCRKPADAGGLPPFPLTRGSLAAAAPACADRAGSSHFGSGRRP